LKLSARGTEEECAEPAFVICWRLAHPFRSIAASVGVMDCSGLFGARDEWRFRLCRSFSQVMFASGTVSMFCRNEGIRCLTHQNIITKSWNCGECPWSHHAVERTETSGTWIISQNSVA
jgi:hypothetical protein